ncbi:hypothetical protein LAZ67_14001380 [Cordylochernes scorpioides]|uniref:Uncharacterized protein n=1 Tax=Cordylochernes scorpioides TaxID=51811 RepID=A0ABY6L6G5_9ARAC|nr:hypothetical protein LAZ67_14001380 [Cordylochernes scorpioides]
MILGKNAQNVQKITDLIKENPRTTLLELEQDTGISKTTIGRIVTKDLKLKKTPAKFIPRFLTNEQKLCRLATCENMLEMTRTDPEWKDKIITGDETLVYDYDPETKRQYAEWRGQDTKDSKNMPRRSRPLIGRNTAASRRYRNAIAIETPLQSETRRALRRLRYSEARVAAAQTMQVPVQRIQLWTHKPFSGLQYNTHIDYKADSSVDIGQMSRKNSAQKSGKMHRHLLRRNVPFSNILTLFAILLLQ